MYSKIVTELLIFGFGAIGYSIMEILYRGYTHWSMTLTGGLCFWSLYHIYKRMKTKSILKKALVGTAFITVTEFIVGCIVNIYFDWNVWDYSDMYFDILGQVCLFYSFLWFAISGFVAIGLKKAERFSGNI